MTTSKSRGQAALSVSRKTTYDNNQSLSCSFVLDVFYYLAFHATPFSDQNQQIHGLTTVFDVRAIYQIKHHSTNIFQKIVVIYKHKTNSINYVLSFHFYPYTYIISIILVEIWRIWAFSYWLVMLCVVEKTWVHSLISEDDPTLSINISRAQNQTRIPILGFVVW